MRGTILLRNEGMAANSAVTAVVLMLTLAGCTATTNGATDAPTDVSTSYTVPPVGEVPQLLDTSRLLLPLDTYLPTLEETKQRSAAHRVLIGQCGDRFGVRLAVPEPAAGVGLESWNERRYGLTDPTAAAELGYSLGARDPRSQAGNREEAPALEPKAAAVLTGEGPDVPPGVPEGGCAQEAQHRLTFIDPTTGKAVDEGLAQRLSQESFQRSKDDPRVAAANADWSSCMHNKGHDYRTVLDPLADPSFQPTGNPRERQTAQDDVACKLSINLVGRWFAVESAYQRILIRDHGTELEALARAKVANHRLVLTLTQGVGQ